MLTISGKQFELNNEDPKKARLIAALFAFIELDRCNNQRDHLAAFGVKYKIPPAPCWRYGYLLREAEAAILESLTSTEKKDAT